MSEQTQAKLIEICRADLMELLSVEDRKTTRTRGSDNPLTFEDKARALDDESVQAALVDYQGAVNGLWEHAATTGIVSAITHKWIGSRRLQLDRAIKEEALSEATFAIRRAIGLFTPDRGSLLNYAYKPVFQALDLWWRRHSPPVEVPDKVARTGEVSRAPLADAYPELVPETNRPDISIEDNHGFEPPPHYLWQKRRD